MSSEFHSDSKAYGVVGSFVTTCGHGIFTVSGQPKEIDLRVKPSAIADMTIAQMVLRVFALTLT